MPRDLLAEREKRQPRDLLAPAQPEPQTDTGWSAAKEADQMEEWRGTGTAKDFLNSGPSGLPFADEIGSAVSAIPRATREWAQGDGFDVGRAYDRNLEVERELRRRRNDRSPVASTAGEVATGLGLGGVAAKGGLTLLNNAKPTVASIAGRGAAEGAAWGGLFGFSDGEGFEDRLKQAGQGVAIGGLVGGGVGGAASIGAARTPSTKANNLLAKALARQGMTAEDATRKLSHMGADAVPADLGPAFREQAEALASMPGKAQITVRNALDQRAAGAGQRITKAANKALGQNVDTIALADDIVAKRSAAAKPLYDAAYAKPVPYTLELESLLKRPSTAKALSQARRMAADEGIPSPQWFANVADDGTVTIQNVPDVRQLDLTKRALDDMISSANRGGAKNEARVLMGIKEKLLGIVDEAVPEYAQARNVFSGPSAILDAMETGKGVFKNTLTPNELRKMMAGMGEGEQEAFQQGARSAIADIMGTARNDANAARGLFEKGYSQEKLAMLIGKDKADEMLRSLSLEKTFMDTRNAVTGNSRTAPRQAVMKELGAGGEGPGPIQKAMNMRFGDAAQDVGGRIARAFGKPGIDARNARLAEALMKRGGDLMYAPPTGVSPNRKALVQALIRSGAVVPQ